MPYFEPVVLFFLLGGIAGLLRSDLRIPGVLYASLSIFLLLATGLRGGVELSHYALSSLAMPALTVVLVGALIPLLAFPVLRRVGRLSRADSGAIAAHYGSVSVVTFAVGSTYLTRQGQDVEGFMTVFLVLLEFPALVIGVLLARSGSSNVPWGRVLHEVMTGKSLVLLLGGLAIGWIAGPAGVESIAPVYFDLSKGVLAFFLLEMGLVAASRIGDFRRAGLFLLGFATLMSLASAGLGLSAGGIPVYYRLAQALHPIGGWAMSLQLSTRKLLTIIPESALEETLIRDIEALGAHGYTVTEARGKGGHGTRDAAWAPHGNIRLEVLCNEATALAICEAVRDRYYANYSMIMYVSDVDVLRPQKF